MESIKEILAAEEKAKAIGERAAQEADRVITDAKRQAVETIGQTDAAIRAEREAKLEQLRAKLRNEQQALRETQEREVAQLKSRARKNADPAAEFLLKKLRTLEP